MISKKNICKWIYIICFVCLDVMIVVCEYKTYQSLHHESIFGDYGNVFYFLTCSVIYGPFLISQLLCLKGSNTLSKHQLQGAQKYLILVETIISSLVLVGYLALQSLCYIPNNIKIAQPSLLLMVVWIVVILSSVLYAIGKPAQDSEMESQNP